MSDILFFDAMTDADTARVGGKGLSLGRMAAAGLPVPPGFVVTTATYRSLHATGVRASTTLVQDVLAAYHRLGAGLVAVRSSATAEDGAETSFAGQQATLLGVTGDEAVLDAIDACWKSLHTDRAIAYRRQQSVADDGLAMAVVVQTLVPAEVAGVLFTRDPQDATGKLMAAEASWGLGEAVVSGRVTPDRFRLAFDTGAVVEKHAGHKSIEITASGEQHVAPERQDILCLNDDQLAQLADLGRRVEEYYGAPRDIEWAYVDGKFLLLQARPITTGSATDRENVRADVVSHLTTRADPRGTVWVRYNLSEVLPEPTPMTWGVAARLLAADGGFGAMNRDLGAAPDPALGSESAFDLVASRPMCNLSRLPRMQFARPPIEYPFAALKADPRAALDPKPVLNPLRDGFGSLLRLPATIWRLTKMAATSRSGAATFAARFTNDVVPPFTADAKAALAQDWSKLDLSGLGAAFQTWTERTLVTFARDSLKPTVFADLAWSSLVEMLKPKLGPERAATAVGELSLGAKPPSGADLATGVTQFAAGRLDHGTFLATYGHRCQNEMELSQPRWSEDPAAVDRLAGSSLSHGIEASASLGRVAAQIDSLGQGHGEPDAANATWERIATEAKLAGPARDAAKVWADRLRVYLGLREAAKHYLLLGYAVIRRALLELGSRTGVRDGIFYLVPGEIPDVIAGKDLSATIAARKKRRQLELSLEVPPVLFSDDLNAIGRPLPAPEGATQFAGTALSAGTAEAAALVLTAPATVPPTGDPYILVCPSTDPAWVPLFAKAKGLVMETGGVLSHGAIVAREFGLPAVAGLPGATRQIRTGQRVRVDGGRGTVTIIAPDA
ncbi:PEP/pyruvate-binding domain-containing protein [Fimbriiglobus ruber]|uniref:Phosphoenolpyruvate synthase n=1 Tax=Fimbriiglobus ruber TaxID=1908690 RepID=A0A225E2S0_9BACT|nr:PEP/pyruvate-binding domain-containing protein [Fimbriiglobus ruber]OWK44376.1 Phosphoenolpyruvate synthase [Fimbriiglobus ruber]